MESAKPEHVLKSLREFLYENLLPALAVIEPESRFADIGVDSFALMELVLFAEREQRQREQAQRDREEQIRREDQNRREEENRRQEEFARQDRIRQQQQQDRIEREQQQAEAQRIRNQEIQDQLAAQRAELARQIAELEAQREEQAREARRGEASVVFKDVTRKRNGEWLRVTLAKPMVISQLHIYVLKSAVEIHEAIIHTATGEKYPVYGLNNSVSILIQVCLKVRIHGSSIV